MLYLFTFISLFHSVILFSLFSGLFHAVSFAFPFACHSVFTLHFFPSSSYSVFSIFPLILYFSVGSYLSFLVSSLPSFQYFWLHEFLHQFPFFLSLGVNLVVNSHAFCFFFSAFLVILFICWFSYFYCLFVYLRYLLVPSSYLFVFLFSSSSLCCFSLLYLPALSSPVLAHVFIIMSVMLPVTYVYLFSFYLALETDR